MSLCIHQMATVMLTPAGWAADALYGSISSQKAACDYSAESALVRFTGSEYSDWVGQTHCASW